jgi:hypothetical protein
MPSYYDDAAKAADDLIRRLGGEKSIRAYHGSPYDFDKFDAAKIGTGEGAQAYGHGLYFAQSPAVAEAYKKSVPLWPQYESPEQMAADYLHVHGTPADAMRMMKDHGMWKGSRSRREMYRGALQLLADGAPIKPKEFPFIEHPPRTYEVEIGHPESALLDYDNPMGQGIASRLTPTLQSGLDRGISDRLGMGQLARHSANLRRMQEDASLAPGQLLYDGLSADFGSASASKKLMDAGIPGIQYFDQLSRGAGQGTRNYVMFPGTEDSIRILRKYGMLAPVAAGAASQYNDAP